MALELVPRFRDELYIDRAEAALNGEVGQKSKLEA